MAVTVLTTRGYIFGHPCHWDDEAQVMRYDDTGEVASVWGGEPRPCPQCGRMPTPEGYDPCIGYLPGASEVCCGHGVEEGYIVWKPVGATLDPGGYAAALSAGDDEEAE